jgi:hypothetical protein
MIQFYFNTLSFSYTSVTWLRTLGEAGGRGKAKSTRVTSNINLGRSQIGMRRKIVLNHSLIYIHTHISSTLIPIFFYLLPLQFSSQKKLSLGRKNMGGAFPLLPLKLCLCSDISLCRLLSLCVIVLLDIKIRCM